MAWFSNALQGVQARSEGFKERMRERAASIADNVAVRAQQLEEAVASNLQGAGFTAREVESRLEADARSLSRTVQATEVLQRWLMLLRSNPQPRYPEMQAPLHTGGGRSSGSSAPGELTFRQIFFRSQALELALDAVARVPELRSTLREFALPSPEVWPEDKPPPVAFAHAFVTLLRATIGPPDVWLPLVGALLSSEKGPADEPCHAWIVQLIAGLRSIWADVFASERESEVERVEQAAHAQLGAVLRAPALEICPGTITQLLENLGHRSKAAGSAYRAWSLRSNLASELAKATDRSKAAAQMRAASAAAIASAASERSTVLDAEVSKCHANIEELRSGLGAQASELRAQLETTTPAQQQLQREVEELELTRQELLKQVQSVTERLEQLRARCTERSEPEKQARAQLLQVDATLSAKVAVEEKAQQRADAARALASTVMHLAQGLAAPGRPDTQSQDLQTSLMQEESERHRKKALESALELAEHEVARLRLAAQAVKLSAAVADEREQSRQALEDAGVPMSTLESDVVGEAEIAQSLQTAFSEIDRGRADVEALCRALGREVPEAGAKDESSPAEAAFMSRASELVKELHECLEKCDEQRAQAAASLPQAIEMNIATPPDEMEENQEPLDSIDAFFADSGPAPVGAVGVSGEASLQPTMTSQQAEMFMPQALPLSETSAASANEEVPHAAAPAPLPQSSTEAEVLQEVAPATPVQPQPEATESLAEAAAITTQAFPSESQVADPPSNAPATTSSDAPAMPAPSPPPACE